jgi:hypothetical protein
MGAHRKAKLEGAAAMSILHIVDQIKSTADWRRTKAEEFPDDDRNLEAAEKLDSLAKEINDLAESDMHRRLEALEAAEAENRLFDTTLEMIEWLSGGAASNRFSHVV